MPLPIPDEAIAAFMRVVNQRGQVGAVRDRDLHAALVAAAPAIWNEGYYQAERERMDMATEMVNANLPPCPTCGCRTCDEADARDCGCDAGCNDGDWAPGVNVIRAEATKAERQRIADEMAAEAGRGQKMGLERIWMRSYAAKIRRGET